MHWNPVGCPVLENSTVTLLFLPTVTPALVLKTAQNVWSVRTGILLRMTALSFLTGSTATTRSTWSPAGRPVRLKDPEVPGRGGGGGGGEEVGKEREREGGGRKGTNTGTCALSFQ